MKTSQFIAALSEAMLKYGDIEFSDLCIKAIKSVNSKEGDVEKEQFERHQALQKIQITEMDIIQNALKEYLISLKTTKNKFDSMEENILSIKLEIESISKILNRGRLRLR